ncbi:hypothetical protein ABIE88_003394 [Bradyrhizobium diazoefficiens]|uniref:hypothetical protein n=1 Tax=Bradyrhizobium diazoefficiens TaxID=1355477 RepID=UPI003511B570
MGQTQYHRRNRKVPTRFAELPLLDELQSSGIEEACAIATLREEIRLFGVDRVRRL